MDRIGELAVTETLLGAPGRADAYDALAELLAAVAQPAEWRRDAACRGMGTELFYPARGESAAEAKAICARCPVRALCLEYATSPVLDGDGHTAAAARGVGIWGGTSERERRRLLRGAKSAASPAARRRTRDARIIELAGQGLSLGEIAAQVGTGKSNVRLIVAKHHAAAERRAHGELERRVRELDDERVPIRDIAAALGVAKARVFEILEADLVA